MKKALVLTACFLPKYHFSKFILFVMMCLMALNGSQAAFAIPLPLPSFNDIKDGGVTGTDEWTYTKDGEIPGYRLDTVEGGLNMITSGWVNIERYEDPYLRAKFSTKTTMPQSGLDPVTLSFRLAFEPDVLTYLPIEPWSPIFHTSITSEDEDGFKLDFNIAMRILDKGSQVEIRHQSDGHDGSSDDGFEVIWNETPDEDDDIFSPHFWGVKIDDLNSYFEPGEGIDVLFENIMVGDIEKKPSGVGYVRTDCVLGNIQIDEELGESRIDPPSDENLAIRLPDQVFNWSTGNYAGEMTSGASYENNKWNYNYELTNSGSELIDTLIVPNGFTYNEPILPGTTFEKTISSSGHPYGPNAIVRYNPEFSGPCWAPVPEPSTWVFFLFGVLGMVGIKKKFS